MGVLFVCVCVRSSDKRVGVKEREGEEAQEATDEKTSHFFGQVQIFWLCCAGLQLDLIIDLIHRQAGRQAEDGRYLPTYLPSLWMDEIWLDWFGHFWMNSGWTLMDEFWLDWLDTLMDEFWLDWFGHLWMNFGWTGLVTCG